MRPTGRPAPSRVVTTVTPVGNMPSVSRKARTAGSFLGAFMMKSDWPGKFAARQPVWGGAIITRRPASVEGMLR
ncbi:hypothetical protein GCM10007933_19650 [Zoogloea oryzae]|uniref:Uncharacterized protein n=1 Tax=Zoogloea oryzae TaxID=310767 RepID=A0ABQ6FDD1_9RHOO|nr:hypothetical protein GCM10007933_19650 [Zoogloea oryzae]